MWGSALGQRRALLDAEAVLLVDDRDGEIAQLEALLDQCVPTTTSASRAALVFTEPVTSAQRTPSSAQPLDREEVLLRQRLGRRHQRPRRPASTARRSV